MWSTSKVFFFLVHPYTSPLESFPNLLTHPQLPMHRGMGAAEPKIGASAWNIKAYLKPLPAETISHAQPLYQPSCQREYAEGCCLFHQHLSLLVMWWNIPPFQHCVSVCGAIMTSMTWKWEWLARNPSEMWSDITKCGLRSPKVAFSNVIFHFIFTDILYLQCRMLQNEKVVSFSVIHNPKRHFLNFMPASHAFLFMQLNWLASEKPHSWYLCPPEICGQRDPCQHYI